MNRVVKATGKDAFRDRDKSLPIFVVETLPHCRKPPRPGMFHTKYAFVDQLCGAQQVDHYAPPINPNDQQLKQAEKRGCMEIAMDTRDGD